MCKDQLCVKHAKFDILYAHFRVSITNAQKNMKPEFLLLDIANFWGGRGGGGVELEGLASFPPAPPSR